jgi:hypothetical protein
MTQDFLLPLEHGRWGPLERLRWRGVGDSRIGEEENVHNKRNL